TIRMCAIDSCTPCASSFTALRDPAGVPRLWRGQGGGAALALALAPAPLLRQTDAEHRAAVRCVLRRDAAAVQLDDAPRDRQPEPGPVRARGEERVEDPVAVLGGQPGA